MLHHKLQVSFGVAVGLVGAFTPRPDSTNENEKLTRPCNDTSPTVITATPSSRMGWAYLSRN